MWHNSHRIPTQLWWKILYKWSYKKRSSQNLVKGKRESKWDLCPREGAAKQVNANNSVLSKSVRQATGDNTGCTSWWTSLMEEYMVAPLPAEALHSHPPNTHSEMDLGACTPTAGELNWPLTGLWQPQSKKEALLNIQCRFWSPQHQSQPLSRG